MIDQKFLNILVCPENGTALSSAGEELIAALNRAIGAGQIRNRLGRTVQSQIEQGLVREDGLLLYPVVDDIPVMLLDEAVPLDQLPADSD